MSLRQWSGRRVAGMWLIAVLIESAIIAASAYQSRAIRAEMKATSRELAVPMLDSVSQTPGLTRTNPRADSALDSAKAVLSQLLADSSVQRTFAGAVTAASEAATRALIAAALLLLPVPIAASAITLRWLWVRRRPDDDLLAPQSAA